MNERIFIVIEAVSLALWVGALAGFALIFAPIAFTIVPNLDVFAKLIATILRALTTFGFVCGALAILSALLRARDESMRPFAVVRVALIAAMLAISAYGVNGVIPAMDATAASFNGPIASVPSDDPRRQRYDRQHRASTVIYGLVLVFGLGALGLASLGYPETRTGYARR
jgi:hypothetical protein